MLNAYEKAPLVIDAIHLNKADNRDIISNSSIFKNINTYIRERLLLVNMALKTFMITLKKLYCSRAGLGKKVVKETNNIQLKI